MSLWHKINYENKYTDNNIKYANRKGGLWQSVAYHNYVPKEDERYGGFWHSANYGNKETNDKIKEYLGYKPEQDAPNYNNEITNQYKYSIPSIPLNSSGKYDYAKASPLLEDTLNKVEKELYNNKVSKKNGRLPSGWAKNRTDRVTKEMTDKAGIEHRSGFDRFIDAINTPQYVVTGAMKNAIKENTAKGKTGESDNYSNGSYGFMTKDSLKDNVSEILDRLKPLGKGAWEGLKAGNPFGNDYKEGETNTEDVLDAMGWERNSNPDFKLHKPSTWDANNIAHGATGFVGDIMLDPLDIDLGDVFRGSGKKIGKKTINNFTEENAEKVLKELAEKGGKTGQEIIGDVTEDSIKHLANKVDDFAGIRKGQGVTVGLLGNKHEVVKSDTLQKVGDATIAPYVNEILDKIGGSKLGKLFSTKRGYKELARTNPTTLAKILKFQDYQKGQSALLNKMNKEVFEYADNIMNEFNRDEQTLIADLIENSKMFRPEKNYMDFIDTKDGQNYHNNLVKIRDSIGQHIEDMKTSSEDLETISSKLNGLEGLKTKLNELIEAGDVKNLKSFNDVFQSNAKNMLNDVLYKDVNEISTYLRKLDDFKGISDAEIKENAFELRHIADKYLEDIPDELRSYANGQEDINEIMYKLIGDKPKKRELTSDDILKNISNQGEVDEKVPSILDMAKENMPKVEEPKIESPVDKLIKEVKEGATKQLSADDVKNMSPEELNKLAKNKISKLEEVNNTSIKETGVKKYINMTDDELNEAMKEEWNTRSIIRKEWEERDKRLGLNKEKLSILDNAKKNGFESIELNDVLNRSKKDKIEYVNEILSTNRHMSKNIGRVSDNVDDWVIDRLIKNIYDNDTKSIFKYKDNYSFRQPFVYKMLNEDFLSQGGAKRIPFNQLSDEGKKAYRTELSRLNHIDDDNFWNEWKTFKSTKNIDKLPVDNIDRVAGKDRSKWIQQIDKRTVDRPDYAGLDVEGKLADEYSNVKEKLAQQMYRKPFDKIHPKGQKRVEKEIEKLYGDINAYGEMNKIKSVVKDLKPYDVYNYNGIKILEPINSKNVSNASDVQKWVKQLPEEVQGFLSKNGVEIRVEDFKVGKADSVYDVGNNIITMLHKDDETINAINELRSEKVFPHEVAHAIGSEYSKSHKIPKDWTSARRKDGVEWVSDYAEKTAKQAEDFADSFALYMKNPEKFIEQFPNRSKLITQSIDDMGITKKDVLNIKKQENLVPRSALEVINEEARDLKVKKEKVINSMKDSLSVEEAGKLYNKYDNAVYNTTEFNKIMKEVVGEKEFNKRTLKGYTIPLDEADFDDRIKETVWEIKSKLDNMFEEEVESGDIDIDQHITDYLTHILNPKYKGKMPKEIESLFGKTGRSNPYAISRKLVKGEKVGNTILNEGTKREINDAMKEIIGDEKFFLEEVAPIYTARAIKHNELMYDDKFTRNITDMFGTRIKDMKDIPEGEKLIMSTKELKRFVKKNSLKPEQVLDYLGFTDKDIDNLVLPIIEITPEQFKTFKPHAYDFHVSSIPEVMFDYINKSGKMQYKNDTNAFLKIFDKYQYLYKLQVTAVNPGFHARNYNSNQFQNYLDVGYEALKPETQAEATQLLRFAEGKKAKKNKIVTRFGKEYTYDELLDGAIRYGVYDEGFFAKDLPLSFAGKKPYKPSIGQRLNPLNTEFAGYHYGRKAGNAIENQGRLCNFIGNIKRGLSMEEAGEHTNKFLFDYGDLTEFEQQFMKRVFPFYTWTRKNIPLQLEMMAKKPSKYRKLFKAIDTLQGMTKDDEKVDRKYVNDFAKDWVQLPGTVSNPEGREEPVFWNPNLPYQDVTDLENFKNVDSAVRHLISNSSPAIKIPIELATNKNMYFDSPINRGEGHMKPAPGYLQPVNYHKLHKGEDVDLKKISPELRYLLDQLTPIRNTGEMIEKHGSDRALHALNTIGGVKVASYDYDKYKTWAIIDRLKELMSE